MAPYKFRLRFNISPGDRLSDEADRVEYDLGEPVGPVELTGRGKDKRIANTTELIVRSRDGFGTAEKAETAGALAENALLIGAALERLGIDFDKEGPRAWLTLYGRQIFAEQMGFDGQLLDDQPGMTVYEDPGNTQFIRFGPVSPIIGRPLGRFLAGVQRALPAARVLSRKVLLGLEIYSASKFEHSLRARFLALVTIIEVLSEQERRSEAAVTLLSTFSAAVREAELAPTQREQLLGSLRILEYESIGSACRRLVARHIGREAEADFRGWYRARSALLHDGKTELDLRLVIDRVDQLVARLLLAESEVAV